MCNLQSRLEPLTHVSKVIASLLSYTDDCQAENIAGKPYSLYSWVSQNHTAFFKHTLSKCNVDFANFLVIKKDLSTVYTELMVFNTIKDY